MTTLEGAVVLVTGGQRGIGKALVDDLLTRGVAKVYATARNPQPPAFSGILNRTMMSVWA